ncbi:MAG: transposase [gamma proteobacterium symbiont of Taylorina sp.]|nr:transposase [gamma proteobacterium symbiont of Taylorina sp.]
MANYKEDLSYQNKFIPVDFAEQVLPGTFEYALAHIVENHLDLSGFDSWYKNDTGGAAAYPPSVMLKIILFAYSRGLISSRRISRACKTNITFMSLSGDIQPHYTSIASFVASMKDQIEPLFTEVLMICDKEGLIGRQMFAIDGCKISSNASKEWSGTFEELKRKESKLRRASKRILARHQAQDGLNEEEINHDLKQKSKLDKSADKIKQFLATNKEKLGCRGKPVKSNITDPDSAKMTTSKGTIQGYNGIATSDDKHQVILQATTCGSVGEQQTLQPAVKQLKEQLEKLSTEDTFKTAKFTADSGFHSEKNLEFMATTGLDVYIADTGFRSRNPLFQESKTYQDEKEKRRLKRSKGKDRLFVPADFYVDKKTMTCRCPAGKLMWLKSRNAKITGRYYFTFAGYLKDCRNCSIRPKCMKHTPKSCGRQVSFLKDKQPEIVSYGQKMKVKIDSSSGRRQYSKRLGTIEPVFGNITTNKGMNRFTLCGQEKVNAQWQMYCLVHNIEKLRHSLH